jgi:hypothetical protein
MRAIAVPARLDRMFFALAGDESTTAFASLQFKAWTRP